MNECYFCGEPVQENSVLAAEITWATPAKNEVDHLLTKAAHRECLEDAKTFFISRNRFRTVGASR
jgi:hypothetical protein